MPFTTRNQAERKILLTTSNGCRLVHPGLWTAMKHFAIRSMAVVPVSRMTIRAEPNPTFPVRIQNSPKFVYGGEEHLLRQ